GATGDGGAVGLVGAAVQVELVHGAVGETDVDLAEDGRDGGHGGDGAEDAGAGGPGLGRGAGLVVHRRQHAGVVAGERHVGVPAGAELGPDVVGDGGGGDGGAPEGGAGGGVERLQGAVIRGDIQLAVGQLGAGAHAAGVDRPHQRAVDGREGPDGVLVAARD